MIVVGGLVFGLVVGFITYRTLVRTTPNAAITDLAAVISAIGGGAVTSLYNPTSTAFAWYAIGLALGMCVFFFAYGKMNGKAELAKVMKGNTTVTTRRTTPSAGSDSDNGPQA